ncbi:MAG: beta-hydroxyacyl-ACP dehydratase [Planctomycetaceae bacterium]|nr:beta-hydroxyacyl-ACP dehydratase [Planctomycetaceae bacterium]
MRWFWIDRFEEFVCGQSARTVKNVSLGEEHLDSYNQTWPYMPASLMVEGLAQTGGLLLGQLSDFKARVVLAKVARASFDKLARPGDRLNYEVKFLSQQTDGAIAEGKILINDQPLGTVELVFASLTGPEFEKVELFQPHEFLRMLRSMRLFEVGRYPNGAPIAIPEHLLAAEQAFLDA